MIPVPSDASRISNPQGKVSNPWRMFFQQFTQNAPTVLPVNLTGSPFNIIAAEPGAMAVTGGTVSNITLSRGSVSIDITGTRLIPVATGDTVTVTYSVAPTVQFLPNFGNRTG